MKKGTALGGAPSKARSRLLQVVVSLVYYELYPLDLLVVVVLD